MLNLYSTLRSFVWLLLLCISTAQAQTWTGAVSANWSDPANWNPATVPDNTAFITIPSTNEGNWPELSSSIDLSSLRMLGGSQIDLKGFSISAHLASAVDSYALNINNAIIKSTKPGSEILIYSEGNVGITNSNFKAPASLHLYAGRYSTTRGDYIALSSNHFEGTTKIYETGPGAVDLSSSHPDWRTKDFIVDGDLEIYRTTPGSSYLLTNGGTVNGNFKYHNPYGTVDPFSFVIPSQCIIGNGSSDSRFATTVTGNIDVSINGNLIIGSNINYLGTSTLNLIGGFDATIANSNPILAPFKLPNINVQKTDGKSVTLDNSLYLTGNVSFVSGYLKTSQTNRLIFEQGATITGGGNQSHVVGPVDKIGNTAFTFPVGSGTKYFPLSISAPGLATDQFRAEYIYGSPTTAGYNTSSKAGTLNQIFPEGFWDVKRVTGVSNVSLSLGYSVPSGAITDQSKLRVAHWSSGQWNDLGNGGTAGSLTFGSVTTTTAVSNFSPFALATADASNPLPVKLADFTAKKEENTTSVQWRTTEEIDSDRFEIERSPDAKNWSVIGTIAANGNAEKAIGYQFSDRSPVPGINYYRLKMIDLDQSFTYSKIQSVDFFSNHLVLYPNPASDKLYLDIEKGKTVSGIQITDQKGQIRHATIKENTVDLKSLTPGSYVFKVSLTDGSSQIKRIIVTR